MSSNNMFPFYTQQDRRHETTTNRKSVKNWYIVHSIIQGIRILQLARRCVWSPYPPIDVSASTGNWATADILAESSRRVELKSAGDAVIFYIIVARGGDLMSFYVEKDVLLYVPKAYTNKITNKKN